MRLVSSPAHKLPGTKQRTLRIATTALIAVVAFALSSCSESASANRSLDDELDQLSAGIACQERYPLYDDPYHYASMRGVICVGRDSQITQIRVYDTSIAAMAALQDWIIGEGDRWLLQSSAWFSIGPQAQLEEVARAAKIETDLTKEVPTIQGAYPNVLDDCVQFVSSATLAYITGTGADSIEGDRPTMDQILPGSTDEILRLTGGEIKGFLQGIPFDSPLFESEFSRFGPEIKTFCKGSVNMNVKEG